MKRAGYTLIIFLWVAHGISSGQDSARIPLGYPVYSQYLHNGLVINPAYAGSREALSIVASVRKQWLGIQNAPVLYSGSLHSPMKNDKVALGLNFQYLSYGVTNAYSIYSIYAYHIRFTKGVLSFGLKAGVDLSNTNYSNLRNIDKTDPVFQNLERYIFPNVGAGIYYYADKFFAGFSVPSFLFYKNTGEGKTQAYHSFREYDFIISAGGLITFSPFFKFKPSVLLDYSMYTPDHINQLDINANFIFADLVWIGGAYRTTEQVAVGLLQLQINPQLMIGFSYDYPVGRMNTYSKGSVEAIIRYEFGSKVSAANPRYF